MGRMDTTTFDTATLVGGTEISVGDTYQLPDGPSGTITRITEGVEYGDATWNVTVRNAAGVEVTRWVPRPWF